MKYPNTPFYSKPPKGLTAESMEGGADFYRRNSKGEQWFAGTVLWDHGVDDIVSRPLKTGEEVYVATGPGPRERNDDRILVMPTRIVVLDGFKKNGGDVADRMAGAHLHFPDSRTEPYKRLCSDLPLEEALDRNSGAAWIAIDIVRNKTNKWLQYAQSGDCRVVHIGAAGDVLGQSKDETAIVRTVDALGEYVLDKDLHAADGTVISDLAVLMEKVIHKSRGLLIKSDVEGILPFITGKDIATAQRLIWDWVHYGNGRNELTSSISVGHPYPLNYTEREIGPLKPGDRVIAGSDGIFDNLTSEEIATIIQGKSDVDAVREVVNGCLTRMVCKEAIRYSPEERMKRGAQADGFLTDPKPDNWSFALTTIK